MADQFIYQMTDTWNNGATDFAGIKMDVTDSASLSTSRLLDLLIGGASKFKVQKDGSVFMTSSAAGAAGLVLTAYHNSASPLALDVPFKLLVQGEDSAGNTEDYGEIQLRIDDPTSTSEDASFLFRAAVAGTLTTLATLGGTTLTLGTNVAVAFAGTGAATTRNNLGLAAGTSGFLFGLTLSNNVGDPTNDIDIAVGTGAEEGVSNPELMTLASALTKRLDAAWAVGTNQGGLDTGSIADGTYHVWLIQRPDTGVVDALFSTSATAPTMPTNYDRKRRIGSIIRITNAIVLFRQIGDVFKRDSAASYNSTSAIAATLTAFGVPTGIVCQPLLGFAFTMNTSTTIVVSVGDASNGGVEFGLINQTTGGGLGSIERAVVYGNVFTNTNRQIYLAVTISAGSLSQGVVNTLGWIDTRGRI